MAIAGGMGSIPGQGIRIPHAAQHGQKKKKKNSTYKWKNIPFTEVTKTVKQ